MTASASTATLASRTRTGRTPRSAAGAVEKHGAAGTSAMVVAALETTRRRQVNQKSLPQSVKITAAVPGNEASTGVTITARTMNRMTWRSESSAKVFPATHQIKPAPKRACSALVP